MGAVLNSKTHSRRSQITQLVIQSQILELMKILSLLKPILPELKVNSVLIGIQLKTKMAHGKFLLLKLNSISLVLRLMSILTVIQFVVQEDVLNSRTHSKRSQITQLVIQSQILESMRMLLPLKLI